jgi:lipoyl-dependent peroxiredoxin
MQRTATAVWNGTLKDGQGSISTPSGTLTNAPYSFLTRFENAKGTNPEELNFAPESIKVSATVSLEKLDAGWTISKIHLDLAARVPGISQAAFESAAASAKANCPVSRLFKAEITLTSVLEQAA